MTKTGQQIEDDIYGLVNASSLPSLISGTVYKFGMRPKNATTEDAIVKFVTGFDGQIQQGVVVINIYVPDMDVYADGIMRKDITRCAELERVAADWVKSLTAAKSDYKINLAQTVSTEEEPDIKQHFVSIRIKFKLLTI